MNPIVKVVLGMGVFAILATDAGADKAEVEKRARDTKVTLNVANIPPARAFRMISAMSGIAIKSEALPEDAPAVTINVRDAPALDAVNLVAKLAGMNTEITDEGISIVVAEPGGNATTPDEALPANLLVGSPVGFEEGARRIELHNPVANFAAGIGDFMCFVDLEATATKAQIDGYRAFVKKHAAEAADKKIELVVEFLENVPGDGSAVKGRLVGVGLFPAKPGRRDFKDVDLKEHPFEALPARTPGEEEKGADSGATVKDWLRLVRAGEIDAAIAGVQLPLLSAERDLRELDGKLVRPGVWNTILFDQDALSEFLRESSPKLKKEKPLRIESVTPLSAKAAAAISPDLGRALPDGGNRVLCAPTPDSDAFELFLTCKGKIAAIIGAER